MLGNVSKDRQGSPKKLPKLLTGLETANPTRTRLPEAKSGREGVRAYDVNTPQMCPAPLRAGTAVAAVGEKRKARAERGKGKERAGP